MPRRNLHSPTLSPVAQRRRAPWRPAERAALRRAFLAFGPGRWREIHAALAAAVPALRHRAGDVEDACREVLIDMLAGLTEEPAGPHPADDVALVEALLAGRLGGAGGTGGGGGGGAPPVTYGAPIEPVRVFSCVVGALMSAPLSCSLLGRLAVKRRDSTH